MKNKFDHLIGQNPLKQALLFYAQGVKATGVSPFLLFEGGKGLGKTEFARSYAKQIGKPLLEVNCGTIKNNKAFFEQIFLPIVLNNEIVLFFDEAHNLPKDLQQTFLTVFNTEKGTKKSVRFEDGEVEFDFCKQAYIFATTEQDKIFPPLKERLTTVDFDQYSIPELGQIMKKHSEFVQYDPKTLSEIAESLRGNARSAVKRAKEICTFCEIKNSPKFGATEWADLCKRLAIHPDGLTKTEKQVLQVLRERGDCTLAMLSAVTGMSRTALQRSVEMFLLQKGYMKIEGVRRITSKGIQALEKA